MKSNNNHPQLRVLILLLLAIFTLFVYKAAILVSEHLLAQSNKLTSISYKSNPAISIQPTQGTTISKYELQSNREKISKAKSWYWQLSGALDTSQKVDVYDLDPQIVSKDTIRSLANQGKYIICYISVGTAENWREDYQNFPKDQIGRKLNEWPDEKWLNVRNYTRFARIIENRLQQASQAGCMAIEGDNVDGYANYTGFALTKSDYLAYIKWLIKTTHKYNMLYGLKNSPELVSELKTEVDFAVVEECQKYNECEEYVPLVNVGKPVFAVEYDVEPTSVNTVFEHFNKLGFIGGVSCYELNGCFKPSFKVQP